MIPWIILSVLVLLALFGLIAIWVVKKGGKQPTDYYALFIMGITWLPIGIFMSFMDGDSSLGNIFIILGAVYLGIGLAHKKDWKKNHKVLGDKEKKFKRVILIVLGLLFLLGLVVFYVFKSGVFG